MSEAMSGEVMDPQNGTQAEMAALPRPEEALTIDVVQQMLGARDVQIQMLSTALARSQQRVRELEAAKGKGS